MKFESKFNSKVEGISEAMSRDAFLNDTAVETGRVSVQDVSDCPDLKIKLREYFNECEDCFEDLSYEMLMDEMNKFRMRNDLAAA